MPKPAVVSTAALPWDSTSSLGRDVEQATGPTTICGLAKKRFLIVLSIAAVLLGLGFGLGIGVTSKSHSTTSSTADPSTTALPAKASSGSAYTATSPSPLSTTVYKPVSSTTAAISTSTTSAEPSEHTASTSCPSSNGTTYTSLGHTFLIFCENDIQAQNKVDLGRVYQPSFNACIDSCARLDTAQNRTDISAVYWVDYSGTDKGTCWCFGNTSRSDGAYVSHYAANNMAWIQA